MSDDSDVEVGASKGTNRKRGRNKRAEDSNDDNVSDLFGSDMDESEDDDYRASKSSKARAPAKRAKKPSKQAADDAGGDEDDDAGDGPEGLYEDEEDRRRLEAMTELERELILSTRAEQRQRERARKALLQQMSKKPKEVEVRASSRRVKATEQADRDRAIRSLAAARERKEAGAREKSKAGDRGEEREGAEEAVPPGRKAGRGGKERDSEKARKADEWDDDAEEEFSDDEDAVSPRAPAADDMDTEYRDAEDRQRGREREYRPDHSDDEEKPDEELDEEAAYDDVRSIQLRRHRLDKWLNEPFFDEAVRNSVVRMGYGERPDPTTGRSEKFYLLMQIIEVRQGNQYKFITDGPSGQYKRTNKYVVVKDGAYTKTMQMSQVSNSGCTEEEFERWRRHVTRADEPFITRREVQAVRKQLDMAENYKYTAEDVKKRVLANRQRGAVPANLSSEKARLTMLKNSAEEAGNPEAAASYAEQIREIDERLKGHFQDRQGMANINKRNKDHNFKMALMNVSHRPEGEKDRGGDDPFARRQTKSAVYWKVANRANADAAKAKEALQPPQLDKISRAQAKMDPAQLIRDLDLDIDVSVLQGVEGPRPLARRLLSSRWLERLTCRTVPEGNGKPIISLTDWRLRAPEE